MKKDEMKGLDRTYQKMIGDMCGYLSTKGLNEMARNKLRSDLIAMAKKGAKQGKQAEEVFTASPITFCERMAADALKASLLERFLFAAMLIGVSLFLYMVFACVGSFFGIYDMVDKASFVFHHADLRILMMVILLLFINWLWMGKQVFSSGWKKYGGFAVLYLLGIILADTFLSLYDGWPVRLPLLPVFLGISLFLAVTALGYYGYSRYRYQKQSGREPAEG